MKRLITLVAALTLCNTMPVMSCGLLQALKNKFSRNKVQPILVPASAKLLTRDELDELEAEKTLAEKRRLFALALQEIEEAKRTGKKVFNR